MNTLTWLLLAAALATLLLWPKAGLIGRWRETRRRLARVQREDALKHILKCEVNGLVPSVDSVAGALHLRNDATARLLAEMEQRGLISFADGRLGLRPAGRELALHIVRAHRLWESYLAERTGVAEAEWHHRAESAEHLLSPQQANALSEQLGHPLRDPHGDAIPDAGEGLSPDAGQPLNAAPVERALSIVHVEDEPEAVFAQLTAQGLRPGLRAYVLEKTSERIRLWADGREHVLAPMLAANISVALLPEIAPGVLRAEEHLADLRPGSSARVLGLAPACRGAQRRRLLDLGFVPGTTVAVDLVGPGGDPTAYRVRGTVVALRREQAQLIRITAREAQAA
jgi:DtxR family Mn-dependent transcriptional regulator